MKLHNIIRYLYVIKVSQLKFILAYMFKKTCILSFPLDRRLGKTTLINKLSSRYNVTAISKYIYNTRYNNQVPVNSIMYNPKGTIYFVDGIDYEDMCYLINRGYILIGYSD